MISITNLETFGWESAIRGMRNPYNSWAKSDSYFDSGEYETEPKDDYIINHSYTDFYIGKSDLELMQKLISGGPVHSKFLRMLIISCDVIAPLYWWKEFDTYKVGTVANSCSTMHTIHKKEFELYDFSFENVSDDVPGIIFGGLDAIVDMLNKARELYLKTNNKKYWYSIIQMLPSSYNQKRTIIFNYEVLRNIYKWRKDHKLDEWRDFCTMMVARIPYGKELITT